MPKNIFLFSFLCFFFISKAQDETTSETYTYMIDSKVYKKPRKISVYLPEAYFEDTTATLPVAYLFDGQYEPYFLMTSSIMEYYSSSEECIPMIIVSIHTEDRWKEFIPGEASWSEKEKKKAGYGSADLLAKFIRLDVLPIIDANYRTEPFRVGIGHSLGGSFVMYEMFGDTSIFDAGIVASPNMVNNNDSLVKQGREYLSQHKSANSFMYATAGNVGSMEISFRQGLLRFDEIVKSENLEYFDWNMDTLNGDNHMTTFIKTLDKGLILLSNKYNISDENIKKLGALSGAPLQNAIRTLFEFNSNFTNSKTIYSADNLNNLALRLKNLDDYTGAINVLDLILLDNEKSDLKSKEKKKVKEKIEQRQQYYRFYHFTSLGLKAFESKQYKESSDLYKKSLEVGAKRGTHRERLAATRAFAQNNDIEAAFEQLDLLANFFKWRGKVMFENDPYLEPLHGDARWEKLMKAFETNRPN